MSAILARRNSITKLGRLCPQPAVDSIPKKKPAADSTSPFDKQPAKDLVTPPLNLNIDDGRKLLDLNLLR